VSALRASHCPTCRCQHGTAAVVSTARRRHGLTQMQLASLIGVSQSTISFWENGQREPSTAEARRCDLVLGTSLTAIEARAEGDG
jgi:transcriptional regulator with XRE-family HTH domain